MALEESEKSIIEKTAESFGRDIEEAKSLGQIDNTDADVEKLFQTGKRTEDSPAHRAVWGRDFPLELFDIKATEASASCQAAMDDCLEIIRKHKEAGTIYSEDGKIPESVLQELAKAGYWGLLIDEEHGGKGASFHSFATFLSQAASHVPTIAGLASVHGCIGAVDPVAAFGNEQQQKKYLPLLASGERLSAFALTEPNAGSDLTAIQTTAELDGDEYVVNGKKLFITNAGCGRTIGLVCTVDGKHSVLIVDLPDKESENFKVNRYKIWALSHAENVGLEFVNFRVPKENLLKGKGLMIAYHGLNKGRVALCATSAGSMRSMLANLVPWVNYRVTYTKSIGDRELVQQRIGELLGLIVGCDALTSWCAWLIDEGYRGEMECIIAKRFGSEALKDAAIEYFMKTHGGRSFLEGHMFGDNIHDLLAPCIYEGEGEMLSLAFFKALTKQHGEDLFLPISDAVGKHKAAGRMKDFNPINPIHAFLMRGPLINYSKWFAGEFFSRRAQPHLSWMPPRLREQAHFAVSQLAKVPLQVSTTMVKHQVALIDRQCRMAYMSKRVQNLFVIACTSIWAARQDDELVQQAADVLCDKLRMEIELRAPSDRYFKKVTRLGKRVIAGEYKGIEGLKSDDIIMPYEA